nr:MAG: hypothetical protein [Crogonang virus 115]
MEEVGKSEIPKGQFRIDSKSWFMTWPTCPLDKEQVLALLLAKGKEITGAVICRELHQDGQPHVHAYVLLGRQFCCKNARFWDLGEYHGRYEKARNIDHCVKYIKKDGDILEHGSISWTEKVAARQEHRRYLGKRLMDGDPLADVVRDDPSLMFGLSSLYKDVCTWKQLSIQAADATDTRGIWIYGPSGVGKSRYVRAHEPSLYLKAQNKWFDGYIGEKAILIDDMDSDCLAHYLKIWTDRYACTGEIKGGHIPLAHERFYVTSNFSIEQLFVNLPEVTIDALKRRFKVIHMLDRDLGLIKIRSRSFD